MMRAHGKRAMGLDFVAWFCHLSLFLTMGWAHKWSTFVLLMSLSDAVDLWERTFGRQDILGSRPVTNVKAQLTLKG